MRRSEIREHVFKLLFRVEFHDAADLDEQDKLYFEPLTLTEEHQKLIEDIKSIDINHLTPLDALKKLMNLQESVKDLI